MKVMIFAVPCCQLSRESLTELIRINNSLYNYWNTHPYNFPCSFPCTPRHSYQHMSQNIHRNMIYHNLLDIHQCIPNHNP